MVEADTVKADDTVAALVAEADAAGVAVKLPVALAVGELVNCPDVDWVAV